MFEKAVLIVGGNKGDRNALLKAAVEAVSELGKITLSSKVYETEAWGGVAKGPFLNQVVEIQTAYSPTELLAFIQQIEKDLGRKRDEHWGDRTMDIDIIYFGVDVINTPELQVPHPFIAERKFVLVPLAEILPEFIHPVLQKSSLEMLKECEDKSEVWELRG
ncbi:2-amino-4-hydroxy-6-hydroxymethyldihydropteridine diphosphokinase [Algoriphagus aquimarinus]|uniref:2-amino-4-hydroxy-6-hydroxymethyldihydropteridine pyrophosphokinase n=1 Tax=Algoriphagus aquimarinus TaxID=237018 RepID=A0A1I1C2W3_9BACT|nr:2-amino-4-hydroxy-6-hydroxymethyldihydropteridine diphosphokinase [Algoriphagus aquimarinus]SFB55140.1 2-amino-4-hydroxy-6-hydroxymethyldihydropteridinediphosphokinase [Algoriphagus aquimarinus]|tara:strand:- start:34102 stop:34587 length:486 start_codon:yes stop_codon:yes gene_type:complete